VLCVDHLTSLSFSDPREALLTLLPRCTALTKLTLVDFTTITEIGWRGLAECASTLRELKLVDVPYATDAQMELVFEKVQKLEKLVLRNLVAVRGECLRRAAFSSLRELM
jgi:hypothetical protein